MKIPEISPIDEIISDSAKKIYKNLRTTTDSWTNLRNAIKEYNEKIIGDLNILHVHRSRNIRNIENVYVKVKVLDTVLTQKYLPRIKVDELCSVKGSFEQLLGLRDLMKEQFINEYKIINGDEAIDKYSKLLILGSAGAGKTTFTKFSAINYARNPEKGLIPVHIQLRSFIKHNISIFDFIVSHFKKYSIYDVETITEELLNNGRFIIYFDGFDEVSIDRIEKIADDIRTFTTKYNKNRYVLTCRIATYKGQFGGFKEVEIEEFKTEDIVTFIDNWFTELESSKEKGESLKEIIKDKKQFSELAKSPLLLSLLCIVYDNNLEIPIRRTTLYKRCLECLLRDWDSQRNFRRESKYSKLDEEKKINLFSELAYNVHSKHKIFFTEDELYSMVSAIIEKFGIAKSETREVIEEIQSHHGIILEHAQNLYSFSHLTFQEYFTANYLVSQQKLEDTLKENLEISFWHEVFILSTALLPDSSKYLSFLLTLDSKSNTNIFLSGRCLGVDPIVEKEIKEIILNKLLTLYFNGSKYDKEKAEISIKELDKVFIDKELKERLNSGL